MADFGRARKAGAGTLGGQVHERLRGLLAAGALSPGEKVSLRTIAARLEVSVQPVREAVSRLVSDRALEVLPNRAVRVPVLTLAQFRELTAIRLVVEGFAAERAATERGDADLAAIRRHEAAFRAPRRGVKPDLVAANQALHFAVYRAAGLPELLPIIEGLWLRIGPVLNLDLRLNAAPQRLDKAIACHARLLKAIEARSAARARTALCADIAGAARYIESRGFLPATTEG